MTAASDPLGAVGAWPVEVAAVGVTAADGVRTMAFIEAAVESDRRGGAWIDAAPAADSLFHSTTSREDKQGAS